MTPTRLAPSVGGNNGSNYKGALYFPKDQLTFVGDDTSINVAVVVADSINFSGDHTVNLRAAPDCLQAST